MKSASSRSANQRVAKSRSTSGQSDRVRKSRVRVTAEHPEADVAHIARGIVRRGLKPIPPKEAISLRIDPDVLAWFKAQGPGYQTRINAVLRAFRDASV